MTRSACVAVLAFAALPAIAALPAGAQEASPLNAIYACAEVADDAARLACFDAQVAAVRQAETAGELVAVDREKVRQIEREGFGFNLPSLPKLGLPSLGRLGTADAGQGAQDAEALDSIDVVVVRFKKLGDGKLRLFLEDGVTWVQTDSDVFRLRGDGPWPATIRRGAVGSYLIKVEGVSRAIRVRRES